MSVEGTHHALPDFVMWVIYKRPKDYPNSFVARRWEMKEVAKPSTGFAIAPTLEEIRENIKSSCVRGLRVDRGPEDDRCIVEMWL